MSTNTEHGVIAYADGLVIDPDTGELIEAPALAGDRLAYVAHTRHGGKEQTKLWDQAIGGYDAYLKRQLEGARTTAVTTESGLVVASRYQRRTTWDIAKLLGLAQSVVVSATAGATAADDVDIHALLDLITDLTTILGLVQDSGLRTADVRKLDPGTTPARWLKMVERTAPTDTWIETKPVLKGAPLK